MSILSKQAVLALGAAAVAALAASTPALADDKSDREARWNELKSEVFKGKELSPAGDLVTLDTPVRAEDAALVPFGLKLAKADDVKAMTIIIDDNPSPVAAQIKFGPAADASAMNLRMRVNSYTNVHAVAETGDGKLLVTEKFVKASGGCSAPAGASEEEALAGAGEMRLRVRDEVTPGKPARATLMIRHPNFTGMQMDQVKRTYTPALYLNDIRVTYNGKDVFSIGGDISLSANPVIEFGFKPDAKGEFKVTAKDTSNKQWEQTFAVPTQSN